MPLPETVRLGRRKRMRMLLIALLVLGVIAARNQLETSKAGAKAPKPRLRPNHIELLLLSRVNHAREHAGRLPLAWSTAMMRAAYFHSVDMAASDCLREEGKSGDTPVDRIALQGLNYQELSENLFASQSNLAHLADSAIAHWLADPRERANLLSVDFRATGIGIARASDGSFFITEDFLK
jgi:uncharacterized protein YkwD